VQLSEVVDSETGMRVELPDLLSVLSHELRGPLGIVQGYLRLMQRQRPPGDPDAPIITAMLDATGRLATIGRQAADLRAWCRPHPVDAMTDVAANDLAAAAVQASSGVLVMTTGAEVCDAPVRVLDVDAVAAALVALGVLVSRERGERDVSLDVASAADHVTFTVIPAPGGAGPATPPSAVAFDRGGQGLSLVVASYVLDAHGAVVARADPPGSIQVHLTRGRTIA
jgi:hypothetical protein